MKEQVTGGIKVEAGHKFHADFPAPKLGEHLWIMMAMFRVTPTNQAFHLDLENLLTIEGPGCFLCERTFAEARNEACKGEL